MQWSGKSAMRTILTGSAMGLQTAVSHTLGRQNKPVGGRAPSILCRFGGRRNFSIALFACALSTTSAAQEAIVKLGQVGPLTGAIAHLGKDHELGARMAIEELNAKGVKLGGKVVKFELLSEDDGADPKQGTAAAQKLVDAKVAGVIGHLNSGTTIPASRIYSNAGIPQISPSATNPRYTQQGYKTAFRLAAKDDQIGGALGHYAVKELKAKSIAIIDDRSAYGQGLADEFRKAVVAAGGKVVGREFTTDKATNFNAILTRLKGANPDLVFFGGMDAVAGPMIRQMKELGIEAKFMGGDGICTGQLPTLAKGAMDGAEVYCAGVGALGAVEKTGIDNFRKRFKSKYGLDVEQYAPYSYDAVMVLADAMVKAGSADPARYLPTLAKTSDFKGVTGKISFDAKGDLKNVPLTMYTYRGDQRDQLAVIRRAAGDPGIGADSRVRIVKTFFATDRVVGPATESVSKRFTDARGDLALGTAEVSIPPGHLMGSIERPHWLKFWEKEDPEEHMILRSAQMMDAASFFKLVRDSAYPSERSAFVFVHGYNVSFEDAALRTAQMAVDLQIGAVPVFYSWPSRGAVEDYTRDEQAAEWTQLHMAQFLEKFSAESGMDQVFVIAHSMGSRVLTRSLSAVFQNRPDLRTRFKQIILAAPDIDADVFKEQILPGLAAGGARVTLYASSRDKALRASTRIHGDARAGMAGPKLVLAKNLETVDASLIDTDFLGHSYFVSTRVLLTDISLILKNNMAASIRPGLDPQPQASPRYWSFRP